MAVRTLRPRNATRLPVGHNRTDLDRSSVSSCGNTRRELDGGIEIIGLEDEAAADALVQIRTLPRHGLAVEHLYGNRVLWQSERKTGLDAPRLVHGCVVAVDGLLLVVGQCRPRLRIGGKRRRAVVDQECVLHGFLRPRSAVSFGRALPAVDQRDETPRAAIVLPSACMLMWTIWRPSTKTFQTTRGLSLTTHAMPIDPSTTAACAASARPLNTCATAVAPFTPVGAPIRIAAPSGSSMTSG